MKLLIAIPTLNLLTSEFMKAYLNMQYPLMTQGELLFLKGNKTIANKRQEIVEYAIENNFTHIFFLDDDVIIPPNILTWLKVFDKDAISGVYYSKTNPSFPLVFKNLTEPYMKYLDEKEEVIEVEGFSFGCSLIKIDVFKLLKEKGEDLFFKEEKDISALHKLTEDIYFFKLCKKHDIKLHQSINLQCMHIDKSDEFKLYHAPHIEVKNNNDKI